jgi:hypothetical protein
VGALPGLIGGGTRRVRLARRGVEEGRQRGTSLSGVQFAMPAENTSVLPSMCRSSGW